MTKPAYVDNSGNINVHILEDIYIPILGHSGADISTRDLWFELTGRTEKWALIAHPTDPYSRLLSIPAADLTNVPPGVPFVLLDKTGPVRAKWVGKLTRYK
jgi:hypothetical protein